MTTEERQPQITQELLDRARAGNREAMTALYEASSLELYRCIHALIRDEDLTLDVQQQSYLQAFSHLDQLRDARRFLPWLRQIAVNEARMQLRRKQPLLFSQLGDEAEAEEPELPDPRPEASPELALERKERNRLMREILGKLSDGQRLILGMYYYEQMPIQRIAADTGLSPGTVKAQLHRGRRRVEEEVRRLEARGVKLCGLTPLPFLLALLKQAEPAAETGEKVLAAALPQSGRAVEAAAVHVGRRFFQTAGGRVLLGLLAAAAVGGGVLGYGWLREQTVLGDLRPTEPILVLHTQEEPETPEDLLPTDTQTPEPLTEPETPEDLTEPVTQATEPPTEPGPEPTTKPSPEPTTEPKPEPNPGPAAPNPTQPSDPIPPEPVATEPTSTESNATQPQGEPQITGYSWPFEENAYDLPTYKNLRASDYAFFSTINGGVPELYTDNPAVVEIKPKGEYSGSDLKPEETGYSWLVTIVGSGSARIFCTLEGEIFREFTVTNPAHPPKLVWAEAGAAGQYADAYGQLNCVSGNYLTVSLIVQGDSEPEISTDKPEVVRLGRVQTFSGGGIEHWYEHGFFADSSIVGAGDANIYVKLNGETVTKFMIHVIDSGNSGNTTEPVSTEHSSTP